MVQRGTPTQTDGRNCGRHPQTAAPFGGGCPLRSGQASDRACPFCYLEPTRKWIENDHALAFPDAFPVTEGHTLVIPRKHVASIYELSGDEQSAIWDLVAEVR